MIQIHEIQDAVSRGFGSHPIDMISQRKSAALPRMVAMYLCRVLTPHSLPTIGRHFGDRDHTTVMYACKTVEQRMRIDTDLAAKVSEIRQHCEEGDT